MKTPRPVLLDSGTTYAKIQYLDTGRRVVATSRRIRETRANLRIVAATGHNLPPESRFTLNELVALAEGGLRLVSEPDFTVLDCGARDVKYVTVRNRQVKTMDWNAECGAFTGQILDLLTQHFHLDPDALPPATERLPVVCGVLGMTGMFDRISQGKPYAEAFAEFLRGIAFNCERLVGRPKKIYLSGGLCLNQAFVRSFECEVVPLGRYVLLEGLAAAIIDKRSHR